MGWLGRLFGAVPKEEMEGIRLEHSSSPYWEVDGPKTFEETFNALENLGLRKTLFYILRGVLRTLRSMISSPGTQFPKYHTFAMGTIWPRPKVFHIPATATALTELARIMNHHAEPELAVHFHIYRNETVLLEWHDAFSQPMLMSGAIPEEKIKVFADKIGKNFRKIAG